MKQIIIGILLLVILMTGCGKSEETTTEREETTVTQSGQVEIIESSAGLYHKKYADGDQAAIVRGEIKNTSQKYVGDIKIKVTFYDSRGYKIGDGSEEFWYIRPGEKRPFSVFDYVDYEAVDFQLEVESSRVISPERGMTLDYPGIKVLSEQIIKSQFTTDEFFEYSLLPTDPGRYLGEGSYKFLQIEIHNAGDRYAHGQVLVTFYDSAGKVVDYNRAFFSLSENEVGTIRVPCRLSREVYDYTWIWSELVTDS